MQLTQMVGLLPTEEQKILLQEAMTEYVDLVNAVVDYQNSQGETVWLSSKNAKANIPSCMRGQCAKDALSIYKHFLKEQRNLDKWNKKHPKASPKYAKLPVLRKPIAIWNSQNYKITNDGLDIPVYINGKTTHICVKMAASDKLNQMINNQNGSLRITTKNNRFIAQIPIRVEEAVKVSERAAENGEVSQAMGIDLGVKVPAVCRTEDGKTLFVGNGRQNKVIRRKYATKRKQLSQSKNLNAIRKIGNKEQRIMRDIDHKISRQIVDFAYKNNVDTIKLESLTGVRDNAKASRKINRTLSNWSFCRLATYIEYKAKLAGIDVIYVNPAYTSQTCPACGALNHADDRNYVCSCGFHTHRDLVGAINILEGVVENKTKKQ